jgi:hypothetical protein
MAISSNETSGTLTHIAGVRLNVAGRVIQRCSLCGAKLCDSEGVAMPLNPDGSVPEFASFPIGRLVQVQTGNPTRFLVRPDTDVIPADTCLEFA